MNERRSGLAKWSPEQIEQGKRWVAAWRRAGPDLERIRREELRAIDPREAIRLLCGPWDYRQDPRAPRPGSGLVEQQRWFAEGRHPMTAVIQAAAEVQAFCEELGWRFCFIGGLAVLRWGEPRETVDVDLTLLTGFGRKHSSSPRCLAVSMGASRMPLPLRSTAACFCCARAKVWVWTSLWEACRSSSGSWNVPRYSSTLREVPLRTCSPRIWW